jgi:myo-inositol-1-phosphate synthase
MAPHADVSNGHANGNGTTTLSSPKELLMVESSNVKYSESAIETKYTYHLTDVSQNSDGKFVAKPKAVVYEFKTERHVPKVGVMLVGWGGNNGTTVTAGILANKRNLVWETKNGEQTANYYGSVMMGSTVKLGVDSKTGQEVHIPFNSLLPMVHPNDLVLGGWDISGMNLSDAMNRAKVLEPTLKMQLRKEMAAMKPLPSIYYPDFIAANQEDRADNILPGDKACWDHVEHLRKDIRYAHLLDSLFLGTANFPLASSRLRMNLTRLLYFGLPIRSDLPISLRALTIRPTTW